MNIFIILALALLACEAKRHHRGPKGNGLISLIKVCELQNICDEDQYGPWIVEKGNLKSCKELEGLRKREAFSEMDKYNCSNVNFVFLFGILQHL